MSPVGRSKISYSTSEVKGPTEEGIIVPYKLLSKTH